MAKIKIETDVETLGAAQEFLRSVISALNRGFKSGKGWVVGEGEVPTDEKDQQLEILAQQFKGIVKNENLTPEDIHEAMQWVFPEMLVALNRIGYGLEESDELSGGVILGNDENLKVETHGNGSGSSQNQAGEGTTVEGEEKVEGGEIVQPGAPQEEQKGGSGIWPWQK